MGPTAGPSSQKSHVGVFLHQEHLKERKCMYAQVIFFTTKTTLQVTGLYTLEDRYKRKVTKKEKNIHRNTVYIAL